VMLSGNMINLTILGWGEGILPKPWPSVGMRFR
jgi:hypothetical protein